MSNSVTSLAINVGGFVPSLNKAGKVTATAEKQSELLNALDSRGILSVALNGKGKISKAAQSRIGGDTLDGLLYSAVKLEGAQVNTLRALLIAEYGEGLFSRASMKGLDGLALYLKAVYSQAESRWLAAETVKQQDRQKAILQTVQDRMVLLGNLVALRDADIARENQEKTAMLANANAIADEAKAAKAAEAKTKAEAKAEAAKAAKAAKAATA